jgi:hypothetical protein
VNRGHGVEPIAAEAVPVKECEDEKNEEARQEASEE